jgi:DNA-binding transcriptional MocR family regulator
VSAPARPAVTQGVAALHAAMRDPKVVPLGSASVAPELLPIAALNRTLAACARELTTAGAVYDRPPGLATLRRQLARRLVDGGASLHEDELVTTVGATEALHLALRTVARPGEAVAVESPTYFGILQAIEDLGLRAVEIPSHARTGMDLDALDDALRAGGIRAVVAVPNASNPLGAILPDEAKERLVRMLARADVPLVEDDVYGELTFEGARPRTAKSFDRAGRVLLCGSVSKTLAPGYRVGWVAPGRYQEALERRKYAATLATPTLPQMAVAELLASGGYDRHLRRLRSALTGQVARMREAVGASFPAGTRVASPRGGFVIWVELPPAVDALELQARALARGVAIAPGPIFSARGRFASCIRLSAGMPWSPAVERAVRTVADLAGEAVDRAARRSA